jgi:hypothetical protein
MLPVWNADDDFVRVSAMGRYRSFLVRWRRLQGGETRIEIEDLQMGKRAVCATTSAAAEYLEAWATGDDRKEVRAEESTRLEE